MYIKLENCPTLDQCSQVELGEERKLTAKAWLLELREHRVFPKWAGILRREITGLGEQ